MKQMRESRRAMNRPRRMHTYLDGMACPNLARFGLLGCDDLPVVILQRRSKALREQVVQIVAQMDAIDDNMLVIFWGRACKGGEGAQWIKQLASRIHRKRTP